MKWSDQLVKLVGYSTIAFMILSFIFAIFFFKSLLSITGDVGIGGQWGHETIHSPIAVVEISGVILEAKDTIKKLQLALEDNEISHVVLWINSPGGAVGPTQEIFQYLKLLSEKKKLVAAISTIAASGGYYLASAAQEIYAMPGSITGSIGVIMQLMDASDLYQFAKLKPQTIKAGQYKDLGSPFRSMTQDERKIMGEMLSSVHQQFISDVRLGRKEKLSVENSQFAEGQIFSGEQAKQLGLVDELGSLWQLSEKIWRDLQKTGEPKLKWIELPQKLKLKDFIEAIQRSVMGFSPFNTLDSVLKHYKTPMLLWDPHLQSSN